MEHFVELAQRQGLSNSDALQFAEKQMEREARKLEQQREREERRQERERQLEENEKQRKENEKQREENEKQRQHEIETLRMRLEAERESRSNRASESRITAKRPKIPTFEDGKDNMDSYLNRFERIAEVNKWPREEWATNLSALLTGKALDTYSRLNRQESTDYDQLKGALLKRYGLTGEGYRKKLRESLPEPNETAGQFITRLTSYVTRWVDLTNTERSFEALRDLVIQEQFFERCPRSLQVYVKEKNVDTLVKMASYVTTYTEAHDRSFHSLCITPTTVTEKDWSERRVIAAGSDTALPADRQKRSPRCPFCGFSHAAEECRRARNWTVTEKFEHLRRIGACYWCFQLGHRAFDCEVGKPRCSGCRGRHHAFLCSGPASATAVAAVAVVTSSEGPDNTEATACTELTDAAIRETVTAASTFEQDKVLMPTANVKAAGQTGERMVRMLLDSGSSQSFVRTSVSRSLGCRALGSEPLTVETFGGQIATSPMQKVQLSLKCEKTLDITIELNEIPEICAASSAATAAELEACPHLTGLQLADHSHGASDSQQWMS